MILAHITQALTSSSVARYRAERQAQIDNAMLYRTLADLEREPVIGELYWRMAAAALSYVTLWEERLHALGQPLQVRTPSWRARALMWLARQFRSQLFLATVISRTEKTAPRANASAWHRISRRADGYTHS